MDDNLSLKDTKNNPQEKEGEKEKTRSTDLYSSPPPAPSAGEEEMVVKPKEEGVPPPPPPAAASMTEGDSWQEKKKLFLVGGLIFLLFLLGGFFWFKRKGGGGSGQEVTLNYWGLWEPEPVLEGAIAQFEKTHPKIKINYRQYSPKDYQARLQNSFARGEGPDIFRFHQTWLPVLRSNLAPVPAPVVKSLGLEENYFPVVKESLKKGDQFYALPLMIDTLALYYNRDILKAAGKTVPRSWWDLKKTAEELTVRDESGRIQTAGAALGTTNNVDHWSDIIGLMIFQNGGQPGKPADKLVEDALVFYLNFSQKYRVWDETLPNSTLAFASGKVAFYFAPSWRYFNLKEINPDLNFAVAPVPQLPQTGSGAAAAGKGGDLTNIGWASFWVEGVWAKTAHPQEAWEFLSFLASREELKTLYAAESQIRDFGEIYPLKDLAETIKNPYLTPFIKEAERARFWYLASFTYDDSINGRMIKYYEDALNAIAGGGDVEGAMKTLSAGVSQVLSLYHLSPED